MSRRRYNRSTKSKRPANRVIQGGLTGDIAAESQVVGYLFEATDPCTATKFRTDICLESATLQPVVYALVYVPSGYNVNSINYPTVAGSNNLYDPSMNILISGVISVSSNEDHKYSRYSRKMKTGDRIALIFYNASPTLQQSASWELSFTTLH